MIEINLGNEKKKYEEIYDIPKLITLKDLNTIKEVFKENANELRKIKSYEYDKEGMEEDLLVKMIESKPDFSLYHDLNSLKYGLIKALKKEIKNVLDDEKKL